MNVTRVVIEVDAQQLVSQHPQPTRIAVFKDMIAIDSTLRQSDRRDRNLGRLRHHKITHRNADTEEDKDGNSFLPQITTH